MFTVDPDFMYGVGGDIYLRNCTGSVNDVTITKSNVDSEWWMLGAITIEDANVTVSNGHISEANDGPLIAVEYGYVV